MYLREKLAFITLSCMLHTGDFLMEEAEAAIELLQNYQFPEKGIDIAFVGVPFLQYERYQEVLPEGIQQGLIVPMYYIVSQVVDLIDLLESKYPESLLFSEEMQSAALTFPQRI